MKSSDFEIEIDKKYLVFTTKWHGHGVGMSQWGANGMAGKGSDFMEIDKAKI